MKDNEVGEKSKDAIKTDEFDINVEKGKLFMNNIHMFEIIRKKIINKNISCLMIIWRIWLNSKIQKKFLKKVEIIIFGIVL